MLLDFPENSEDYISFLILPTVHHVHLPLTLCRNDNHSLIRPPSQRSQHRERCVFPVRRRSTTRFQRYSHSHSQSTYTIHPTSSQFGDEFANRLTAECESQNVIIPNHQTSVRESECWLIYDLSDWSQTAAHFITFLLLDDDEQCDLNMINHGHCVHCFHIQIS